MYELIQVSGRDYYIQSPAKIGLVRLNDRDVCLIDSGNDKDAGKKVRQILDMNGWKLTAIYNTHSNADHIGGNRYLQEQTGCRIFAPGMERDFAAHPILEPSFLYGGNPPKALRHKFLLAQESEVLPLTEDALPAGWRMIPLPGHAFDMAGFRTPDGIVFLADCLASEETLEKYQISFLVDAGAYLKTLEAVQAMEAPLFIPAHAGAVEDISPLVRKNAEKVLEIGDRIEQICREPVCFDQLLQRLFEAYGLSMTFEQHALVGSTVRSYLTWLSETGRVAPQIDQNRLLWAKQA